MSVKRINKALSIIRRYGGIDGGHHKQWVLDQVVRVLTASDAAYQQWVRETKQGEDGPESYSWEKGVAP